MKKILMLLDQTFPPDERVEKEALSLIKSGFEVHILCVVHKKENFEESYKNIHIHRFFYAKKLHNKFSAAYLALPFHKLKWKKEAKKLFQKEIFDIIHVHDLPLSNIGFYLKKKYKVKLVCDQHEYFSNWIRHTAHYNTFLGKIVHFFSDWKRYEKKYLLQADLVGTVEEPLRKCYIKEVEISPEKVVSIPNTPLKSVFNEKNIDQKIVQRFENDFVIFYAGVVDILRGLDVVVEALPELRKHIPNIKFVIAGRFATGCNLLEKAEKLGVGENIEFVGYVDSISELPSYIAASDICIFTPKSHNDEINKTIATKIYQYALMKRPIIVSDVKMMKEFVEKNNIGLSIKEFDDFIRAVKTIYNKEYSFDKAQNLAKSFSWEETVKNFLKKYAEL